MAQYGNQLQVPPSPQCAMFLHQKYLCPLATVQNTTHKLHLALKFICILYHPTEQQKP